MAQYIDKSALVAEIERRTTNIKGYCLREGHDTRFDVVPEQLSLILAFLDTLEVKEEGPASNDLEEAAHDYTHNQGLKQVCGRWESKEAVELQADNGLFTNAKLESAFLAGAQWQKEQFEKNRLEHCDNITEEQYNLETGFIDYYLDKYHRMPTFLDAIEYGMKKAKEK